MDSASDPVLLHTVAHAALDVGAVRLPSVGSVPAGRLHAPHARPLHKLLHHVVRRQAQDQGRTPSRQERGRRPQWQRRAERDESQEQEAELMLLRGSTPHSGVVLLLIGELFSIEGNGDGFCYGELRQWIPNGWRRHSQRSNWFARG